MITSMTGFGEAQGGQASMRWNVEIRSWNHRFFECSTRLPSVLNGLEERVRESLRTKIKRGKIAITISVRHNSNLQQVVLDEKKIELYLKAIRKVQKKFKLKGDINIESIFSIPDLFTTDAKEESADAIWRAVSGVIGRALDQLVESRAKEGSALEKDLKKRIGMMEDDIGAIESVAKEFCKKRFDRLKERTMELAQNITLDSNRLEQEIAFQAERGDITEELVRAKHHLSTFRKSLQHSEEVGKKLDFIAQEIHREVNTIASKAQDPEIADRVIGIKSELEKIREQIQNVE